MPVWGVGGGAVSVCPMSVYQACQVCGTMGPLAMRGRWCARCREHPERRAEILAEEERRRAAEGAAKMAVWR